MICIYYMYMFIITLCVHELEGCSHTHQLPSDSVSRSTRMKHNVPWVQVPPKVVFEDTAWDLRCVALLCLAKTLRDASVTVLVAE